MTKSAFSLLELSIVLVIIGLIAGGITAGSSMIRAAGIRAMLTEFTQYQTAVHMFHEKYSELPGDMTTATTFWGEAHATPATCYTSASIGTETCNGDGSGNIDDLTHNHEKFRFWQHLANAELINGTFNGVAGGGGANNAVFGENTPESKLSGAGWGVNHTINISINPNFFSGDYNNMMRFGSAHTVDQVNDIFTAEEAWNIDKKTDDGKPGQGNLVVVNFSNCTDAADSTDITADYALSNKEDRCSLAFRNAF